MTTLRDPRRAVFGDCRYHMHRIDAWRGGEPTICNPEHSEIGWFGLDAACSLNLALPEYRALFQKILS